MNSYDELKSLYKSDGVIDLMLSYSRISDFAKNGPKALVQRTTIENKGVHLGSLVDDLLLEPKTVDDKYYVFNGTEPTATMGKLAKVILQNYAELPDTETIVEIIKKNKFWSKFKDELLTEKAKDPDLIEYLKAQYSSKIKKIITTDDLVLANEIKDALLIHDFSKDIFNTTLDCYNQVKFKLKYKGFNIRGILDRVMVNHKDKTVRFIDLKTGANPAEQFMESFLKYKYYFQAIIYKKAFKNICKQLGLKNYTLLPFQFLYIGRYQKIPMIYTMTKKWEQAAIKGFTYGNYKYRGLDELLDMIKWHYDNRVFDLSKTIYESNGTIELYDDLIEVNK